MVLWVILWFMENGFRFDKTMFYGNRAAILLIIVLTLYIWQIAGLLFAESLDSGFERIFKRLSFLIFPLVLFYPGKRIINNINLIIRLFAICTFIYIIYCFGNALHNSFVMKDGSVIFNPHPLDYDYENFFYSSRFSAFIHPSYLAMYVVLSLLISFEALSDNSQSLIKKCVWLFLILTFFIVLYLLSSRAGILAVIIVCPVYFVFKFYKRLSGWIIILSAAIILLIFFSIAKTNFRINYALEMISKDNLKSSVLKDERYNIWRSAFGVIKKNFILGVGTGDASNELKKEFIKRGYVEGYYDNMNSHNQYIEILLESGIIGLIIFLSFQIYMTYIAISDRNLLYGLFIIMMVVFFSFETLLNRLAGITFYPLFSFLLLYTGQNNTE
jgi:O-antigen ligase